MQQGTPHKYIPSCQSACLPACFPHDTIMPRLFSMITSLVLSWTLTTTRTVNGFQILDSSRRRQRKSRQASVFRGTTIDDDGIGIGIDLGTTNSAVAYLKDGIPAIIPIPDNGRTTPSLVAMTADGRVVVGKEALCQSLPPYSNVKRVIGTGGKISAEVKEVVPYLIPNKDGKTYKKYNLDNQLFDAEHFPTLLRSTVTPNETTRPETISSHIVAKLKQVAEEHTGRPVKRAVVGVPAYFNDAQREATIAAAQNVGIQKVKLLREPEAAALAYGIGKEQVGLGDEDELVLAFDLGGGTFDVSMLVVGGGVSEIICTAGNAKLGGADFDGQIARHLKSILGANGAAIKKFSADAQNKIVQSAEKIRIHLSNSRAADLLLPLAEDDWLSMDSASDVIVSTGNESPDQASSTYVSCQITRREMERLCKDEFQALLRPVREVAIMAGALLPGDTSPTLVEAALDMEEWDKEDESLAFGDFYDEENGNEKEDIDSDTLLQLQEAALKEAKRAQQKGRKRARDLSKEERKFRQQKRKVAETSQVSSVDGVKVQDGITGRPISRVVLVGGATRMPAVGRLIGALTGVTPQKTVNPDEAVALGCAANVGILDGVDGMGKILSPMQAAILRAMAEQQGMFDEDLDEAEFGEVEYF
eukprot:scaffold34612_cov165-Amphora_coffeaeformis.AAC.1